MRKWNETHFYVCSVFLDIILTERKRHAESRRNKTERDKNDVASALEPDETRHMMCPSNPPAWQDSTNTPAFFLFLVFTSFSFCSIVSAWSCLLWPTVSLFCRSSPGVFTLYFLSPLLPLRTVGYTLRILSFLTSYCLCTPPHTHTLLLRSAFVASVFIEPPFILIFSFMLTLFVIMLSRPPTFCVPLPLFPGAPAVRWAWCPAICAGWHEELRRPLKHIQIIYTKPMGWNLFVLWVWWL